MQLLPLGQNLKFQHDIRVNLLGDCKRKCSLLIESYRSKWAKGGCTIMADGWSDKKQRTLLYNHPYFEALCFWSLHPSTIIVQPTLAHFDR
jgi:hypothetical protein